MKILRGRRYLVSVGVHVDVQKLTVGFDAYAICTGTPPPATSPFRQGAGKGNILPLNMLAQQNHILDAGVPLPKDRGLFVNAHGERVLVIGGGDTGSDCIGTSIAREPSA